ncbi:MAG: hypothetical protein HFP81_01070 [Methylococcales symbiont of Hymedesmia sp. n. MRB-2018]|nr:MAG: hypothetical protein HFP78_02330 [Methylococcales symbiont of Hymedesmia sp. n. MRB-2018]KAF3984639.1 MAG: hypothetical protein HFP81_01070 [Methylococcales symbiont of Hymedesmia sp. n. MRB-2018]
MCCVPILFNLLVSMNAISEIQIIVKRDDG